MAVSSKQVLCENSTFVEDETMSKNLFKVFISLPIKKKKEEKNILFHLPKHRNLMIKFNRPVEAGAVLQAPL